MKNIFQYTTDRPISPSAETEWVSATYCDAAQGCVCVCRVALVWQADKKSRSLALKWKGDKAGTTVQNKTVCFRLYVETESTNDFSPVPATRDCLVLGVLQKKWHQVNFQKQIREVVKALSLHWCKFNWLCDDGWTVEIVEMTRQCEPETGQCLRKQVRVLFCGKRRAGEVRKI